MGEECSDCEIGIEPVEPDKVPTTETDKVDTTTTTELPMTKIEEIDSTSVAEVPVKAEVAAEDKGEGIPEDVAVSGMLGILTARCLLTDEEKREQCWKGIEPLETNKEKPLETVKRIIEIEGAESLEKTMDALHGLIEEAKKAIEDK
jgi:hypothetical protein